MEQCFPHVDRKLVLQMRPGIVQKMYMKTAAVMRRLLEPARVRL